MEITRVNTYPAPKVIGSSPLQKEKIFCWEYVTGVCYVPNGTIFLLLETTQTSHTKPSTVKHLVKAKVEYFLRFALYHDVLKNQVPDIFI